MNFRSTALPQRCCFAVATLVLMSGIALMSQNLRAADCTAPSSDGTEIQFVSEVADIRAEVLPSPLTVGNPFSLRLYVCSPSEAVRITTVSANMPAHGHGMNYRPTIRETTENTFISDGWLFHMPGVWEVNIRLTVRGVEERLSAEVHLGP